ncbi:hypothetical protein [Herbidospora mongoliensis]|uniref:hypothetical protein n=1 Tax=Herbidospora mongoliensis TaxID=688067 RepID=UPI000832E3BB|nr:hypothetical protein [Herbidospora mongoliensis]
MALIYPVHAEADDSDDSFESMSAEWSSQWVIEVTVRDEGDDSDCDSIVIGPMAARPAWDYVHELEALRPGWTFVLQPIFEPTEAPELVASLEA